MRRDRRLMKQSFGINKWNLADLPTKISNVRLAWLLHTMLGWGYCFSHEQELSDHPQRKNYRSWRFYRHRQYHLPETAPVESGTEE